MKLGATWKDLVIGAFVAFMFGGIVARLLIGSSEQRLTVEVDGPSLSGARKIDLSVNPAVLRMQCAGGCDDLTLSFTGSSDAALVVQITDLSGGVRVMSRDAVGGRVRLGGERP